MADTIRKPKVLQGVQIVTTTCPACSKGITTQADSYQFRRIYLCELHKVKWDAMDARQR